MLKIINSFKSLLVTDLKACNQYAGSLFHTSSVANGNWNKRNNGPQKFRLHNKVIFEPQLEQEKPRPAVSK